MGGAVGIVYRRVEVVKILLAAHGYLLRVFHMVKFYVRVVLYSVSRKKCWDLYLHRAYRAIDIGCAGNAGSLSGSAVRDFGHSELKKIACAPYDVLSGIVELNLCSVVSEVYFFAGVLLCVYDILIAVKVYLGIKYAGGHYTIQVAEFALGKQHPIVVEERLIGLAVEAHCHVNAFGYIA